MRMATVAASWRIIEEVLAGDGSVVVGAVSAAARVLVLVEVLVDLAVASRCPCRRRPRRLLRKRLGWAPNPDGNVYSLLATCGTVYAGGNFAEAGGRNRRRLASLDPQTGASYPWRKRTTERSHRRSTTGRPAPTALPATPFRWNDRGRSPTPRVGF